jgi:metal-responsive CopG/Arc/MetJ family transcriptional regulator
MGKIKRIAIFISLDELDLLDKVDAMAKENYMSRSRFTKMAWRAYMKFLKRRIY